jgi:hypothetical protein
LAVFASEGKKYSAIWEKEYHFLSIRWPAMYGP